MLRLEQLVREMIAREGPIDFARFMATALYDPALGYYSSGRAAIGRGGDYFTSVSVGPLFGIMLAAQFAEIWEKLERPEPFTIVEQGAHHGGFAGDVLAAARLAHADFFAALRYLIVEPFPILRERQQTTLAQWASKTQWVDALETLPRFCGVHFSNELLDAMPVRLFVGENGEWRERLVDCTAAGFVFVECPVTEPNGVRLPTAPNERCEIEVCSAALDWLDALAGKLERGLGLIADYGVVREETEISARAQGTLQVRAGHRLLASPFEKIGEADLTAHVDWQSVAEGALARGFAVAGFTDQHHFLTGLLAAFPELADEATKSGRALQTLLHPEFLGRSFQFLGLAKNFPDAAALAGFRFARPSRVESAATLR